MCQGNTFAQKEAQAQQLLNRIKEEGIQIVDVKFCDPFGQWQHCSFVASAVTTNDLVRGFPFDGSSIRLFTEINQSDMVMVADLSSSFLDPFTDIKTLSLIATIYAPETEQPYERCPRGTAERAIAHLKDSGIATDAVFGPEPEFFIFDNVKIDVKPEKVAFEVDSEEAPWNSGKDGKNLGHHINHKRGYFPVGPLDRHQNIRTKMLLTLEGTGVTVEKHHHEVATSQSELGIKYASLIQSADNVMKYKYVVKNVARDAGLTATFMPKPLAGDNGTGMHVHQSLRNESGTLFAGSEYAGLSKMCLYYIGGILKHARSILAFTNPTTNSYKRLVPGFEAPTVLAFSQQNRSAAVRIPMYEPSNPQAKRLEFRCPDPSCNPYLAFSAMLMAGLDGIKNEIYPSDPLDIDIFTLTPEKLAKLAQTPKSLDDVLDNLEKDHDFLTAGGVFSEDFIQAYIEAKREEISSQTRIPHPVEFSLYYSV